MSNPLPRVLIFEASLSGHRANYVAIHARELLRLGAQVCLAVPHDALDQPEGKVHLNDVFKLIEHFPLPDINLNSSPLTVGKTKLNLLCEAVRKTNPEHCYVPYADGISQAWGMKLKPSQVFDPALVIEGLTMRSSFAYPQPSWKSRFASLVSYRSNMRANWTRLHFLDPLGFNYVNQRNLGSEKHFLIPDIIEKPASGDAAEARRSLNLSATSHVIACPGAANAFKGSDKLIDAVLSIDDNDLKLILFGKHSDSILNKLQKIGHDDRILSINRFATESEFNNLFLAADTIAVCYPRHYGSASILIRASAYEKPIIGSDWGWIGWAMRNFQLGQTCDATRSESIRDAIVATCQATHPRSDRADQFVRYHSPENHLAHWTDLYQQRFRPDLTVKKCELPSNLPTNLSHGV